MTRTLRHSMFCFALGAGLMLAACDGQDSKDASAGETAASIIPAAGDSGPVAIPGPEAQSASMSEGSPGGTDVTEDELPPPQSDVPVPPRQIFSMDGAQSDGAPACAYDDMVGKKVDEVTLKASGKIYRVLAPDSMMTMDHNPDRINVVHDKDMIVTKVWCG